MSSEKPNYLTANAYCPLTKVNVLLSQSTEWPYFTTCITICPLNRNRGGKTPQVGFEHLNPDNPNRTAQIPFRITECKDIKT